MNVDALTDLAGRDSAEAGAIMGVGAAAASERKEEALILQATREIRHVWTTVLCWQEAGRPAALPLTAAEVGVLQARGRGEGPDGQALPPYLVETYRAACLWYYRAVRPATQDIPD